ncbi:MAG TPA: ester cyclase [Bradyrhizobium sp.]|jgi:predicted ester cyclase|nr:ester cyclase [Bradyrhizobium sp.]
MSDRSKQARAKQDQGRLRRGVELLTALALSLATPAFAADSVKINDLVVAVPIPDAQREATLKAVRAFYDFWNTGDEALLKEAVAPNFTDHTLPPGRPQGPEGPAFASRRFRAAVPDLKVTVDKMIVAGEYVTVHMNFTGHFTGRFGQAQGKGQPVPFIATDLVKIENGRVTDNWHIEDNLALLQEMGVAKVDQ